MATLYLRGDVWWLAWGKGRERKQRSLKLRADQKAEALLVKAEWEAKLKARTAVGLGVPRTVGGWRKQWLEKRAAAPSVDDDAARLKHARELDDVLLSEIRVSHVRALIQRLRREAKLAPRTIRHVYATLHKMFADASSDDLIQKNPCDLMAKELPPKKDLDPTWRAKAVFTRAEAERLMSDDAIPTERRFLYSLLLLSGVRIGEAAALRWNALERAEPLDRLYVSTSFHRKTLREKGVKTDVPRQVPVHPTLARALAEWRLTGWAEYVGHKPRDEDLIIPTFRGTNLRDPVVHSNLLRDLEKLGLRPRRTHDTRRTFISLCRADGARPDLLKCVTHGPPGDIMDLYTTTPWDTLCAEVAKLNLNGRLAQLTTLSLHTVDGSKKR